MAWPRNAAVFGAMGGIGAALCRLLADRGVGVWGGSRSGEAPRHHLVTPFRFDLEDEQSIKAAAAAMAGDPPEMVVVATGVLTLPDGTGPERRITDLDPTIMAQVMQVNAIGPAMIARHMLPLMPREGRWVFGAISARLGSISDNRLGGWHSCRASKAALNMVIRNAAIEMRRTHPMGAVVALHPGTVDTDLSRPFQSALPAGQLLTRREAAVRLLDVMLAATPDVSGRLLSCDGSEIAP